jgi:hypothetical protein
LSYEFRKERGQTLLNLLLEKAALRTVQLHDLLMELISTINPNVEQFASVVLQLTLAKALRQGCLSVNGSRSRI